MFGRTNINNKIEKVMSAATTCDSVQADTKSPIAQHNSPMANMPMKPLRIGLHSTPLPPFTPVPYMWSIRGKNQRDKVEEQDHCTHADELPEDELEGRDRRGHQQFKRTALFLFCKESHRQERNEEEQHPERRRHHWGGRWPH